MRSLLSLLVFAYVITAAFVAPVAQAAVPETNAWYQSAQAELQRRLAIRPIETRAKNVILFIADGNGLGTNFAIRVFQGQQQGGLGEEHALSYETLPYLALAKTYNVNAQTPDSAGTASALQTGVKTKAGVLGVDHTLDYDDCKRTASAAVPSIGDLLAEQGKSVGYVSTARITHATPAAGYAKAAKRSYEDDSKLPLDCTHPDIARQLITRMREGDVDLAFGGGRRHFLPVLSGGRRLDGRHLIQQAQQHGIRYIDSRDQLLGLMADLESTLPVLGLFDVSHMDYEHDRQAKLAAEQPSLREMTQAAIAALSQNPEGYYLMVEAGRVDHANHRGNLHRAVTDGVAFADAVQQAMTMTDPQETLLIVTADHGHALTFNGYCGRGTQITGLCYRINPEGEKHSEQLAVANDNKPYSAVGYGNGPGSIWLTAQEGKFAGSRPTLTQKQALDPNHKQLSLLPMSSETHSPEDVAIYARGPWAHLFSGTVEQHYVFHVMLHAAMFTPQ